MNNRILELAAEAEDYADSIVDQGGEFHLTYTKKFAELIVSDAIDKIESVGFKSSNDIPFAITDLFVSQIKQYFGVK